jgi:hypothetical protein
MGTGPRAGAHPPARWAPNLWDQPNDATLSLVTILVPVSTLGCTVCPRAAATAVSMPSEPIFAGNWATDPVCSPALMAFSSSGEASKPMTMMSPGFLPALLMAWSAP